MFAFCSLNTRQAKNVKCLCTVKKKKAFPSVGCKPTTGAQSLSLTLYTFYACSWHLCTLFLAEWYRINWGVCSTDASPVTGGSGGINSMRSLCKILTQRARLCNATTGLARVMQTLCISVYVQSSKVLNDISKGNWDGWRAKCVSWTVKFKEFMSLDWLENHSGVYAQVAQPLGTTKLHVCNCVRCSRCCSLSSNLL